MGRLRSGKRAVERPRVVGRGRSRDGRHAADGNNPLLDCLPIRPSVHPAGRADGASTDRAAVSSIVSRVVDESLRRRAAGGAARRGAATEIGPQK